MKCAKCGNEQDIHEYTGYELSPFGGIKRDENQKPLEFKKQIYLCCMYKKIEDSSKSIHDIESELYYENLMNKNYKENYEDKIRSKRWYNEGNLYEKY